MSLKDIIANIRYAAIGVSVEITDPWQKREVEQKMRENNITFATGYNEITKRYCYALLKGKKKNITDFIKWFVSTDYRYYEMRHAIFKTKLLVLIKECKW